MKGLFHCNIDELPFYNRMVLRMDQVRVRRSPPQSHNPSPDHSTDGAGGPGNKWFDKAGDVCLIMYLTWSLLSHAKYMSGSAWRCCVKLRWEPENMAMKKKKSWYVGYVWSSHTSWLLNVWDQSGISWRKDVRILSLFATVHKQGSCCMCMYVSTHTEFSLSPPSSFLCSNNNNSRGTSFTVTTTPFPVCGLLFLSDDSY